MAFAPLSVLRAAPSAFNPPLARITSMYKAAPPLPPAPSLVFRRSATVPVFTAGSAVRSYVPPPVGPTIPVPTQTSPQTSPGGLFATLARFSQPSAAFQAFTAATGAVGGLRAPTVTNSPATFLENLGGASSPIAPFNPPVIPPASQPVDAVNFQTSAPAPAMPPANAGQLPSGGFDPYSSADGSTDYSQSAPPAPAPATMRLEDFVKANPLLVGGVALGGIFLLSRMFR